MHDFYEASQSHSDGFLILGSFIRLCYYCNNIQASSRRSFNSVPLFALLIMITEFFPSVMLIFCFVSMLKVVFKHIRAARSLAKQLRFNHRVFFKTQEKSAIIMMGIVISLCLLCYGIHFRCSVIFLVKGKTSCNDTEYKIPVLVLNSAINPMAYSFFKRDINKELKRRLCCDIF